MPIRWPGEIEPTPEPRELFQLEMIRRGFYLARRGMIALSQAVDADEGRSFVAAVEDSLHVHGALLGLAELGVASGGGPSPG
jgi:glutamate-1-semialdehyde 2,1-aminomutase